MIERKPAFEKAIKHIKDKALKERIKKQIKKIIDNPEIGDFLNYEEGIRKVYIPPFRILYVYKKDTIFLLDFDHRDKVYKKRRRK